MNYWNNGEYYGFGVAAHGYKNGLRYGNIGTIEGYITNPNYHITERNETDKDRLEEEIFLGLRKIKHQLLKICQRKLFLIATSIIQSSNIQ